MSIKPEQQKGDQQALRSSINTGANKLATDGTRMRIRALLLSMRPRQWTKNLALFVGLVFAQQLLNPESLVRAILAFAVFCLASSSIYLLNDILDLENDRQHPIKSKRPLASGNL